MCTPAIGSYLERDIDLIRVSALCDYMDTITHDDIKNPLDGLLGSSSTYCFPSARYEVVRHTRGPWAEKPYVQAYKTYNQISQIVVSACEDSPLLLEHALASTFDGIPGIYIRK